MSSMQLLHSTVLILSVVLTATDEQDGLRGFDEVMARRHQVLLAAKPISPAPIAQPVAAVQAGPPAQVPTLEQLSRFPGPPAIRPFNELTTEKERLAFREHMDRLALQARRAQIISRQRDQQIRRN